MDHPDITHALRTGYPRQRPVYRAGVDDIEATDVLGIEAEDYAETQLSKGRIPTLDGFISLYPEFDHDDHYDRIETIIEEARRNHYEFRSVRAG